MIKFFFLYYWHDQILIIKPGSEILEFEKEKKADNLSAVFSTKWGVPETPQQYGNWLAKERDYSTVE